MTDRPERPEWRNAQERPCKGCGAPIAIMTQGDGTKVPIDLRAPTWRVERDLLGAWVAVRDLGAFVSHFKTCPTADQFSAAKKGKAR